MFKSFESVAVEFAVVDAIAIVDAAIVDAIAIVGYVHQIAILDLLTVFDAMKHAMTSEMPCHRMDFRVVAMESILMS